MRFENLTITIGITVSIVFLFVIGISQSQADFEIEEMYPSYGSYYDYTGSLYHTAYVKTSGPYSVVYWYINGNLVGYSDGDNVKTEAEFSPSPEDYPGSPFGQYYTIKAVALSLADDENNFTSYTDSYDVIVYTPTQYNFFFGGHTFAEMEVYVDVGWNGLTAEIVVGGVIRNWDNVTVIYGFNGTYKVGRKTKILKQLDETYLADALRGFGGLPKLGNNVVHNARFARTDSYTLGSQLPGFTYFVEAQATMTARRTNDKLTLQDLVKVDEYDELPVIRE